MLGKESVYRAFIFIVPGCGFDGSSAGSVSMGAGISSSSSSSSSMFELDPEVVGAPLLSTAMSKGCWFTFPGMSNEAIFLAIRHFYTTGHP